MVPFFARVRINGKVKVTIKGQISDFCIRIYKQMKQTLQKGKHNVKVSPLKMYRKNSKNWDTLNYYRDCPTNGIVGFYSAILRSKDADRITNRVDTDQTAP